MIGVESGKPLHSSWNFSFKNEGLEPVK